MTDTKVFINGKPAGEMHQGGFYRFSYDITDLLKPDKKNLLEVKIKLSKGSKNPVKPPGVPEVPGSTGTIPVGVGAA